MSEKDDKQLRVIESEKTAEKNNPVTKATGHTNPILKKFLEFHHENSGKFSVKDLFKK